VVIVYTLLRTNLNIPVSSLSPVLATDDSEALEVVPRIMALWW